MRDDYYGNSKDYINRWVVSYADLLTLLLAFFLVMYALNVTKHQALANDISTDTIKQEKLKSASLELQNELKRELVKLESVQLLKDPRGFIIRINNNLIFEEGSADLNSYSNTVLEKITEILAKIKNPVIIEGHTDTVPIKTDKYPSNWELSTARATNLINYLITTGKIKPNRLSAVGYGEYMPVADNTSNNGRMSNRRVDIIILENWIGE